MPQIRSHVAIWNGSSERKIRKRRPVSHEPSIISELWAFMRMRKKWWLLPILVVMLLLGSFLVFAQGSALAPFIYTIF